MQKAIKRRMKRIHAKAVQGREKRYLDIETNGPTRFKKETLENGAKSFPEMSFLTALVMSGMKSFRRKGRK